MESNLIIVEGLTGSGKSTMAHFIARQLEYNGIAASWLHEGEMSHPILIDVDTSIESYMAEIRVNWAAFVDQVGASTEVCVVEACFFNNLLETLMAYNVERAQILRFAAELQALGEPLNPILVYLVQEDVEQALARTFDRRGAGFRDFVIDLATSIPLAVNRGWEGCAGMLQYWQEFVALTDKLFERFPYRKIKIDNTAADWETYNLQVCEYLSIPLVPEQTLSSSEASRLIGFYQDRHSGRDFAVRFEDGELHINLFLKVWTRLVRRAQNEFLAEGWPFVISFEADDFHGASVIKIGGRDVDYLALVGTVAERASV
jgi:thymidylate kinase